MAYPAFKLLLSALFGPLLPFMASPFAAQASSAMASPQLRLPDALPGCERRNWEAGESLLFREPVSEALPGSKRCNREGGESFLFREPATHVTEDPEMQVPGSGRRRHPQTFFEVRTFRAAEDPEMEKDAEMQASGNSKHLHPQTFFKVRTSHAADDPETEKDSEMQVSGNGKHLHPQTFFEVRAPLDPPPGSPCASLQVLRHSFGNSYSKPPARAHYNPPSVPACNSPSHWGLVVLKWSASSVGRQFDRISAVWIGGVEFLRTCTAEPTKQGIVWEIKKDVTKYVSVLAKPQTIVVELGNLVNDQLTGVFHVNLTLDFFSMSNVGTRSKTHGMPADLVLPLSSPSPLPGGHWFSIPNSSYSPESNFSVPSNVYKAVLEVCLSYHGDDEFWYTNPPNEFIERNNLTGFAGNGPFREVQAHLDGKLVAAIWPFPVVYTGGIINLYWRPAAAIGAFDLPTYEFDLSPFVGILTDGKQHSVDFRVENAIGEWLIDGSLHLWFDQHVVQTHGSLVDYSAAPYTISQRSDFTGLNGSFRTTATRTLSYSGVVLSSGGNISVSSSYSFEFNNIQIYKNNLSLQTVSQLIQTKSNISMGNSSEVVLGRESFYSFPLDLSCINYAGVNGSFVLNCNFSHGFNKNISSFTDAGRSFTLLNNMQQAQGEIVVVNSTVIAGVGALQQQYHLQDSSNCYNRDLQTRNATILLDKSSKLCV